MGDKKRRVVMTFEIDVDFAEWQEVRGCERSEVREDIRSYLLTHVQGAPMLEDAGAEVGLR